MLKDRRGVTLTELMVATALLSVGILGFFSAFKFITKSISVSRARTLATNLAQEKVETLKNLNYYSLLITTSSSVDNNFSPPLTYDNSHYPAETIDIGGMRFLRYTFVALAQIDDNAISTVTYTYPDTGMKQITVNVIWQQDNAFKRWSLSNLLENPNVNPLDSSFSGYISSAVSFVPIAGALVRVQENADWNDTTDSGGYYAFRVYHGSYTIRASSSGWYDTVSSVQSANSGSNTSLNMQLTKIASGTIRSHLWVNPDLVISMVVVASQTYKGDGSGIQAEFIQLFNPTTGPIDIGTGGPDKKVYINYYDENAGQSCGHICFNFTHVSSFVPAGEYYLLANTSFFLVEGQWTAADAWYNGKKLVNNNAGCVEITRPDTGIRLDAVGWSDNGDVAPCYEGQPIPDSSIADGIGEGNQIVRVSSPGISFFTMTDYGRAYDSGNNRADFIYPNDNFTWYQGSSVFYYPRSSINNSSETVITGKPAYNAFVAANDSLSGSTRAWATYISSNGINLAVATFELTGVATGTWTVVVASGSYYKEYGNVTAGAGQTTWFPHATTSPQNYLDYHVKLDSAHAGGFIEGLVSDVNSAPLNNIKVLIGGTTKTTGTNGRYFAKTSSGPVSVIANPISQQNTLYVESIAMVDVETGQLVTKDFTLTRGGTIVGFVTTGTTPLPNAVVTANISGSQYGSATSDGSGYFYIRNISTGVYTVQPVLEAGQDSSPNSVANVTVTGGAVIFAGTFTFTGAFGSITGTVTSGSSLVTTGALILASTATIASTPASVCGSSSPALVPLYAVSSKADGSYELPVRGSTTTTYNLAIYLPTINTVTGTVSVTTKTYSGISVTAGQDTSRPITIP